MATFMKRNPSASLRLKARLASGEVATLINTSHPSASLVEKLGAFSFDAVLIDCEHGSATTRDVEDMARAANLAGLVSIVRPERGIDWLVTRYMECGIDGLMIPLVETAAEARSIVDALRFCDPFHHGERLVVLMIETITAIRNLPEILAVDGVDAYLIAPGDLAVSMGETPYSYAWHAGERSPAVVAKIDEAIAVVRSAGRPVGTLVNHEDVAGFVEKGVTLLYDHVNHMVEHGARAFHTRIATAVAQRRAASTGGTPPGSGAAIRTDAPDGPLDTAG